MLDKKTKFQANTAYELSRQTMSTGCKKCSTALQTNFNDRHSYYSLLEQPVIQAGWNDPQCHPHTRGSVRAAIMWVQKICTGNTRGEYRYRSQIPNKGLSIETLGATIQAKTIRSRLQCRPFQICLPRKERFLMKRIRSHSSFIE